MNIDITEKRDHIDDSFVHGSPGHRGSRNEMFISFLYKVISHTMPTRLFTWQVNILIRVIHSKSTGNLQLNH